MPETPTVLQRRTAPARAALAAKFKTPEEKSAHYRELARRSNDGRVVLSAADAAALGSAYCLLARIAANLPAPPTPLPRSGDDRRDSEPDRDEAA